MAYDARLAARLRAVLGLRADVGEKPMFGGLTFMVAGTCAAASPAMSWWRASAQRGRRRRSPSRTYACATSPAGR